MGEPFAIWVTGLPASGKSTITMALVDRLKKRGITVQVLESDALRDVLTPHPTYSLKERDIFYNAMVYIGGLLIGNGVNVIFDATANKRRYREKARHLIKRFMEVYVRCPIEVCMERDRKGIYAKAKKGEARTVPGIQEEYEPPEDPTVIIDSDKESPQEGAERIMKKMEELAYLPC